MKPSRKWRKIQPIYKFFGGDYPNLDYSEEAAIKAYTFETSGKGDFRGGLFSSDNLNGYVVGKHWMDANIKMYLQDIRSGLLYIDELYEWYPDWGWWIDKTIKKPLGSRVY